ncbi:MAG: toxic anion resistance protein [Defluviitaleaceae bacterium]|nr:toxic anion resistance protein [Defluviitaleaceae bacterium]
MDNFTPSLTLTPDLEEELKIIETKTPKKEEISETIEELNKLTPKEREQVKNFASQIDITNTNIISQYGVAAQKHIADFSSTTLNNIRAKDMGDVGSMLTSLTVELSGINFDEAEEKGVKKLFKKAQNRIAHLKSQYDKAEVNVNKIVNSLEKHQIILLKDINSLDKMYELNLGYFKELTMYILAGKERIKEIQENEFKALQERALKSGLPEDAQAANDMANQISRFERKLHDLELTRIISIQMAPQIRMIQNNDTSMLEKLQTSIMSTIPLWKSQMVLALSMHHSSQAMEAQKKVNDMTNALLQRNAEKLKMGSIEIAKEAERGVVDIETLKKTNQNLIETLEEVRKIQVEGAKKRQEASIELEKIESDLKNKLLEASGRK